MIWRLGRLKLLKTGSECVNSHWPHLIAISGPTPGLLPPLWGREKACFLPGPVLRIPGFSHLLKLSITCNGYAPPVEQKFRLLRYRTGAIQPQP